MKAIVVKGFIDKNNKILYKKGQVIELNEKRLEEINSTTHGRFVEAIKEKKEVNNGCMEIEGANKEEVQAEGEGKKSKNKAKK